MDIVERSIQKHLDLYSEECVSILGRLIDFYAEEQRDCDTRLECICEVFEDFCLSLTFVDFPGMGNYGQVLSYEDDSFMKEPKFLDKSKEREILQELESYFIDNNINEEDEFDVYESVTSTLIPEWLAKCWVNANEIKGTKCNLFYFVHRYFNEPAVNLINKEKLFLEDLEKC